MSSASPGGTGAPASLTVTVLFFAAARERAGCATRALVLPAGSRVADALAALAREHDGLAAKSWILPLPPDPPLVDGEP